MQYPENRLRRLVALGAIFTVTATLGIAGTAVAGPIDYHLLTTIPVPPSGQ